jgi:hypothetical protein
LETLHALFQAALQAIENLDWSEFSGGGHGRSVARYSLFIRLMVKTYLGRGGPWRIIVGMTEREMILLIQTTLSDEGFKYASEKTAKESG